jgi:hypothetical protein
MNKAGSRAAAIGKSGKSAEKNLPRGAIEADAIKVFIMVLAATG